MFDLRLYPYQNSNNISYGDRRKSTYTSFQWINYTKLRYVQILKLDYVLIKTVRVTKPRAKEVKIRLILYSCVKAIYGATIVEG